MSELISRDQILSRKAIVTKLDLSDSGQSVYVKRLNPLEFERIRTKDPKDRNTGMQLAACLCDPSGNPIFDVDNEEETNQLGRHFSVGESQDIIKAALANPKKEDIKKNLETILSSDSPTP